MAQMTWDEKIEKAKEAAAKKAEQEGLDETATQALIDESVNKVMRAKEKAEEKAAQPVVRKYVITVNGNPDFCGIGAGGVQFANGEAHITSDRMAQWFREHEGYTVAEE